MVELFAIEFLHGGTDLPHETLAFIGLQDGDCLRRVSALRELDRPGQLREFEGDRRRSPFSAPALLGIVNDKVAKRRLGRRHFTSGDCERAEVALLPGQQKPSLAGFRVLHEAEQLSHGLPHQQ